MESTQAAAAGGGATTTRPSPRRRLLLAAALGLVLAALAVASLFLHFRNTPSFREYLRTHPSPDSALLLAWPDAELLAEGALWRQGDVDPFAVTEADGSLRCDRFTVTTRVSHGEELLAEVRHEVAIAVERESGARRGLAIRTSAPGCDPDVHVLARTWIADEPLLGPGRDQKGSITFDVVVAAGAGEARCDVARAPAGGLAELPSAEAVGWRGALADWTNPSGRVAPGGLVHRVRRKVFLTERVSDAGHQGVGRGEIEHAASTLEYSYTVEQKLEFAASSASTTHSLTRTFNGRVW